MLRELLRLIAQGGQFTPSECALRLGVSESALEGMIGQLVSLGYLEEMPGSSSHSSCAGCPMAGGCHGCGLKSAKGKTWFVTRKGHAAAQTQSP